MFTNTGRIQLHHQLAKRTVFAMLVTNITCEESFSPNSKHRFNGGGISKLNSINNTML